MDNNKIKVTVNPYQLLFQSAPISIWREDFSDVKLTFDNLKKYYAIYRNYIFEILWENKGKEND